MQLEPVGENSVDAQLRFHVMPDTTVFVGYNFKAGDYTGDEIVALNPFNLQLIRSDARNYYAHSGIAGIEHAFNESLSMSLSGGATYTDNYNSGATTVSPTAVASLTYTYLPGSSLTFGFRHARNATDTIAPDANGNITQDQESSTIFLNLVHRLTPRITATVNGTIQDSEFRGGQANNETEVLYLIGLNLAYAFNEHFSTEIGYNFDKVDSDIVERSYDRNYVYIGVTAAY